MSIKPKPDYFCTKLLGNSELRVQVCNSIPTRGVGSAHQITACPPGFENLAASLYYNVSKNKDYIMQIIT